MKWILFIMLFATPAKNLTQAEIADPDPYRQKFESHRVWTLQSTSSMEFSTAKACAAMENAICQSIIHPKVATMTLRMWCTCDSNSSANPCPNKASLPIEITEPCGAQLKEIQNKILSFQSPAAAQQGTFTILRAFPPE